MEDFFEMVREVIHGIENHHDSYTKHREIMTGELMSLLGNAVGLNEKACGDLAVIGSIHDIGKLTIPAAILEKPAPLNAFEREVVQLHPRIGVQLIEKVNHPLKELAIKIILNHHEAFDGSGYPHGLSGKNIPLEARICSICDVYDALRSHRPYRDQLAGHKSTMEKILSKNDDEGLFNHFDPDLLEVFEKISAEVDQVYIKKNG